MPRYQCEMCGANRGIQRSESFSYCHSCHKAIFTKSLLNNIQNKIIYMLDIPEDCGYLPKEIKQWLAQYYITERHIKKYNICWSSQFQRIIFKYNDNKSAWARSINPKLKNKWLHLGENNVDYIINSNKNKYPRVLVEDCISAIRVGDFQTCIALGGLNINKVDPKDIFYEKYNHAAYKLILWLDGDRAGQTAAEAFRKKFKLYAEVKNIVTKKDPKCHTPSEMEKILNGNT